MPVTASSDRVADLGAHVVLSTINPKMSTTSAFTVGPMHAVDAGSITAIDQRATITSRADKQTA